MRIVWSTLKFQRRSSSHITDDDVIRATNRIANVTTVSNAIMLSKLLL